MLMENLETQNDIISLGKQFVQQLELERDNNTFPRWIAHYIAEKMTKAELAQGDEKEKLEQECFNAILKLWEHRWKMPDGYRPFENFEPLFEFLHQIDRANHDPYYYQYNSARTKKEETKIKEGSTEYWLAIARDIDSMARFWLDEVMQRAADVATDESTEYWLRNAVKLPRSYDSDIISLLIDRYDSEVLKVIEDERTERKEELQFKIDELERYSKLNEFFLSRHKEELLKLDIESGK